MGSRRDETLGVSERKEVGRRQVEGEIGEGGVSGRDRGSMLGGHVTKEGGGKK